jgi:hypothetical protein
MKKFELEVCMALGSLSFSTYFNSDAMALAIAPRYKDVWPWVLVLFLSTF